MNTAAQALGKLSGAIAHQRAREPILERARQMIPHGQQIPAALIPPLILTMKDRV